MFRISRAVTHVLVLALITAAPLAAQSANGSFSFTFDGYTKTVDFNARSFGSSARGEMTFTGSLDLPDQDTDGEGTTGPTGTVNLTMTLSFDCLNVSGHRASMSGLVTQSSVPGYVGRRGLLVVEDNGEGINATRDSFTWGLYRSSTPSWTPSDAELPFDNGASLVWYATDAEREDDAAVISTPKEAGDCRGVGLGAYALDELIHGNGNVQVRP